MGCYREGKTQNNETLKRHAAKCCPLGTDKSNVGGRRGAYPHWRISHHRLLHLWRVSHGRHETGLRGHETGRVAVARGQARRIVTARVRHYLPPACPLRPSLSPHDFSLKMPISVEFLAAHTHHLSHSCSSKSDVVAISALGLSEALSWRIAVKFALGQTKFDTMFELQALGHHFNLHDELGIFLHQP